VSFIVFAPLLTEITGLSQTTTQALAFIGFGLGALTYAKHPEGIVEAQTRKSLVRMTRWLDHGRRKGTPEEPRDGTARVPVGVGR
jgi:hypothetical protein